MKDFIHKITISIHTITFTIHLNEHLACWVKNSADDTLKQFPYFCQKLIFDISCKSSSCMICQILFSVKNKESVKLLSVKFTHSMLNVKKQIAGLNLDSLEELQ